MRRVFVCAFAALALAGAGVAQETSWQGLMERAGAMGTAGDYAGAAEVFREAIRVVENAGDLRLPRALDGLANVYDDMGKYADAERLYRRALALVADADGGQSPVHAAIAVNLGVHYMDLGQPAKAESALREAIAIFVKTLPADNLNLIMARNCLASVVMATRRYEEGETLIDQALAGLRKGSHPGKGHLAVVLTNLGVLRHYQDHDEEAAKIFEQAISSAETELGADHPLLIRALNNLALVDTELGRRDAAEAALRRAVAVAEKRMGADSPVYGNVLLNYSIFERKYGNKTAARAMQARAKAVLHDVARRNGVGMTIDASSLRAAR